MASWKVEYIYRTKNDNDGSNSISKQGKKTSATEIYEKKGKGSSGLKGNLSNTTKITNFKTGSTIGAVGGAVVATLIATITAKNISKVGNFIIDINTAKTGETMRANNQRQTLNAMLNPLNLAKKAFWEEGYLRNLQIARQNASLEYERQLTGNLIYSKNLRNDT